MTSKEQERQAVVKIKKIIEGLGENSYVGAAMEGVLDVAERNIEFDAAFSLKGAAESAEKRAAELEEKNRQQADSMETLSKIVKGHEDEKQLLRQKMVAFQKEAQRLRMTKNLYSVVWETVYDKKQEAERKMQVLAEQMANAALEEGTANIKELAQKYRSTREDQGRYEHALDDLESKYGEGGRGNE